MLLALHMVCWWTITWVEPEECRGGAEFAVLAAGYLTCTKLICLQTVVCKDVSKHVCVHVHTSIKCPIAQFAVACTYNHGCSHRMVWYGLNYSKGESNEYSITTTCMYLIACFALMQSICYLDVADNCWSSLWWQRTSLFRRYLMISIIPGQGSISWTIIRLNEMFF